MQPPVSDGTLITGRIESFEVVGDRLSVKLKVGAFTAESRNYALETIRSFLEGSVDRLVDVSFKRWRESYPDDVLFHNDE